MSQLVVAIIDFQALKGINLILMLGLFQPLLFMLCPNYHSNNSPWVLLIIRPELVLFEYSTEWCYLLYIVLALIVFDKLILLLIVVLKSKNFMIKLNSSLYTNIFLIYLLQPLSTICVQAILISFNALNYGYCGFGLLLFILLQIESIIRLQLSESVTLKIIASERLVVGSLEYLVTLLNSLQMVIYTINDNQRALLFQFLLEIYKQLSFRSYIRDDQIIINIFCISISLSISLGILTKDSIYGLLAFPLITQLLYNKVFENINKALLNPEFTLDTILINIIYSINNPKINSFRITAIKASHRRNCSDLACKCRSTDLYTDLSLHLVILEDYYLKLIQSLAKYQETQYSIYWFPSILMQLGYPSQSLKEINRILNKVPDKFQYFTNRSQTSLIKNIDVASKQISQEQQQPKRRISINISRLQRASGEFLQKQVLMGIQQAFKSEEGNVIILAIEQFYRNESNTIRFQNDIIQIVLNRIKFYQTLINNKSIQMIYKLSQTLSNQIDILELQLKQQFEKSPTKRNQSLLCFYQAEILTNILDAYKYQNLSSLQEERLISLYNDTVKYSQ